MIATNELNRAFINPMSDEEMAQLQGGPAPIVVAAIIGAIGAIGAAYVGRPSPPPAPPPPPPPAPCNCDAAVLTAY